MVATSTTAAITLAGLSFNGLDGIAATGRGLLLNAQRGMAFVVDTTAAKEFALAHWLVGSVDGGWLFVRSFDIRFSGDANHRHSDGGRNQGPCLMIGTHRFRLASGIDAAAFTGLTPRLAILFSP